MAKTQATPKNRTKTKALAKAKTPPAAKAVTKTGKPKLKTTTPGVRTAKLPAAPPAAKTKLQIEIDLLGRPLGASIDEVMAATGWQAHSVRGAFAGSLKKKGIEITSAKLDGCRRYSIAKAGGA